MSPPIEVSTNHGRYSDASLDDILNGEFDGVCHAKVVYDAAQGHGGEDLLYLSRLQYNITYSHKYKDRLITSYILTLSLFRT